MSETEENFSPEISQSEDIILNKDNLEINDEIKEQTNNDSNKEEENNVQVSPDSSSNETNEETTIDVLDNENQDNSKNSVVEVQKSNKTTKEFSCDSCGKHFLRVSSVQQHLKNEHKDNPTTTYSEVQTNEIFESGEFDVNSSNNQFHENFRDNDFTKIPSKIDNSVTCELCLLTFTEEANRCQGLDNKWRFHVYSKHLKRKFENSFANMISDKLCSLGDCKSKSFPSDDGVIKHLIGKKHGILEQFIKEELLQDKTSENHGEIDVIDVNSSRQFGDISLNQFHENFREKEKEIKKETVVENFEVDDEIMPYSSPAKNFSNLETSLQETAPPEASDNVKKSDTEEIISRKKCELCDKTLSQYSNVRRKHLYFNHFKERIDKEINWEPTGKICPKGNTISKYGKFLYVLKFWAQLFTSLKADLRQDINGGFAFLKKVLR